MWRFVPHIQLNKLLEAVRHFRSVVLPCRFTRTNAHAHQCCRFQSYAKTVPSRMKLTMREPASMTTDRGHGVWRLTSIAHRQFTWQVHHRLCKEHTRLELQNYVALLCINLTKHEWLYGASQNAFLNMLFTAHIHKTVTWMQVQQWIESWFRNHQNVGVHLNTYLYAMLE